MPEFLDYFYKCFGYQEHVDTTPIEETEYWIGPAGIRVPVDVAQVPAIDGVNYVERIVATDGPIIVESELDVADPMYDEDSYRETFAELRDDGHWYWK